MPTAFPPSPRMLESALHNVNHMVVSASSPTVSRAHQIICTSVSAALDSSARRSLRAPKITGVSSSVKRYATPHPSDVASVMMPHFANRRPPPPRCPSPHDASDVLIGVSARTVTHGEDMICPAFIESDPARVRRRPPGACPWFWLWFASTRWRTSLWPGHPLDLPVLGLDDDLVGLDQE